LRNRNRNRIPQPPRANRNPLAQPATQPKFEKKEKFLSVFAGL
jgi:hypothetical protein